MKPTSNKTELVPSVVKVSADGKIVAILVKAGNDRCDAHLWRVEDGGYVNGFTVHCDGMLGRMAMSQNAMYTGNWKGGVHAYDISSGRKLWGRPEIIEVQTVSCMDTDRILCGVEGNGLMVLDAHTGGQLAANRRCSSDCLFLPDCGVVISSVYNKGVVMLDALTLKEVFSIDQPETYNLVQMAAGGGTLVFSGLNEHKSLYMLRIEDGRLGPAVRLSDHYPDSIVYRDRQKKFIYVENWVKKVFSLNPETGETEELHHHRERVDYASVVGDDLILFKNGKVISLVDGKVVHENLFSNLPSEYTPPVPGPVDPRVDKVMREVLGDDYRG